MKLIKTRTKVLPAISTASLPDIVFILLFFFMTVTVFSDKNVLVSNDLPQANALEQLVKENGVIEILIGSPNKDLAAIYGDAPTMQLGNTLGTINEVKPYVLSALAKLPNELKDKVTIALKVDKRVKMGVVADVKAELQAVNLVKISFIALEGSE